VADFTLVDEMGATMMEVGETGFDAGDFGALDPTADFELPGGADVSVGDSAEVADMSASDGGGWLSDTFGGDSGDSGGDSGCSSCSSCSSCGGCS